MQRVHDLLVYCIHQHRLRDAAGTALGVEVAVPGLGRLYAPDARDHLFMARPKLDEPVALRSVMYSDRFVMDQGDTGTCVGHGWKGLLVSAPCSDGEPSTKPTAMDIYCASVKVDEFEDNDDDCARARPHQSGTSVRAAAKVLQTLGYINEYNWAFDAATVLQWLVQHGPV